MPTRDALKVHADLVDRMAQTVGVDLEQAVLDDTLRVDYISTAVLRCTDCGNADHCARWLDAHAGGTDKPVEYCRNIALFDRARTGRA